MSQPLHGARHTQQAERRRRRRWDWPLCHEPRVGVLLSPSAFALSVLHPAAPSRRETLDTASASMAMAALTSWWEWWAGLWSRPPDPGTPEAWLEELRLGALLDKEAAKPPGGRDEERIHQLELLHIALKLENVKVGRRRRRRRQRPPHERRQQQFAQCHRWRVDSAASTCFFDAPLPRRLT